MILASNEQARIIRTERGLTIFGTRITIYDVMDHLVAGRSPELILNWLPLTEAQLATGLAYIQTNFAEVEAEYQVVQETRQEIRQYWEEQNRERFARIALASPRPGQEALWAKLQAQKAQVSSES